MSNAITVAPPTIASRPSAIKNYDIKGLFVAFCVDIIVFRV
jgi:hypothetical protein